MGKRKFKHHDNFTSTRARGIVNGSGRIMVSRRYPLIYKSASGPAGITGFPTGSDRPRYGIQKPVWTLKRPNGVFETGIARTKIMTNNWEEV